MIMGMLDTKEAGALTGYTPQRLVQLAKSKQVQAIKRGRIWLFNEKDLKKLFKPNIDVEME